MIALSLNYLWLQWQSGYSDTFPMSRGCHCKRGDLYFSFIYFTTTNNSIRPPRLQSQTQKFSMHRHATLSQLTRCDHNAQGFSQPKLQCTSRSSDNLFVTFWLNQPPYLSLWLLTSFNGENASVLCQLCNQLWSCFSPDLFFCLSCLDWYNVMFVPDTPYNSLSPRAKKGRQTPSRTDRNNND